MRGINPARTPRFAAILLIFVMLSFTPASSQVIQGAAIDRERMMPPANAANTPLEDTYWKLTELDGQPVNPAGARMEPHIVLDSKSHRLNGSGGCNQVSGSYEVKDNSLSFGRLISSMLPCRSGFDIEQRFFTALRAVKTWQITGSTLDLYDASGKPLAQFEAQPAK